VGSRIQRLVQVSANHANQPRDGRILQNQHVAFYQDDARTLSLWDYKAGRHKCLIRAAAGLKAITFPHNDEVVAYLSGNDIYIWALNSGGRPQLFTASAPEALALSPDGSLLGIKSHKENGIDLLD
jgi:WD40 repeat protein